MELFPKLDKNLFTRRVIVKGDDPDILEAPSPKLQLMQWERIINRRSGDNETALEREMEQMLEQVNSFIHKLEITSLVHSKSKGGKNLDWSRFQAFEHRFKDQLKLGQTVMEKIKELLDLEDNGIRLSQSIRTLSNKSSTLGLYAGASIQESDGNISTISRYGTEIKDVMRKLDHIINNKDIPLPSKFEEVELLDEEQDAELAVTGNDALHYITERLGKENIQPIFKLNPLKESEQLYTVVCQVFNITVEGKATEKHAAKKDAAVKMLERLVDECAKKRLPPQITPLSMFEMNEAVSILCETERYDIALENFCVERRKLSPRYHAETGFRWITVRCYALGLQGIGSHVSPIIAKRAAARDVLIQFRDRPRY